MKSTQYNTTLAFIGCIILAVIIASAVIISFDSGSDGVHDACISKSSVAKYGEELMQSAETFNEAL